MKADKYGAYAEQVRFKNGWVSGSQNKSGEHCRDCKHFNAKTIRCDGINERTQLTAVCEHFLPKGVQS